MPSSDFSLIDRLVQGFYLERRGLAGEPFLEKHRREVYAQCNSADAINDLKQLAAGIEPAQNRGD